MFAKHINYSKTKGPGDFSAPCEDAPEFDVDDDEVFSHLIGDPGKPDNYDLDEVSLHIWENEGHCLVMKKVLELVGNNDDKNIKGQAEIGSLLVDLARDYLATKAQDAELCMEITKAINDERNEP